MARRGLYGQGGARCGRRGSTGVLRPGRAGKPSERPRCGAARCGAFEQPRCFPGAGIGECLGRGGYFGHQRGNDPAHDHRAEDGRAELTGQPGRICGGHSRGRAPRPGLSHDDDPLGHDCRGQGIYCRRGGGRFAGYRHREAPRRKGGSIRHACGGGRASAESGSQICEGRPR